MACPTSSSNSSAGRANSENCSSSKVLVSGVLLFGFGVGQHVTHTKGFVLASLSGAHCGYMSPQLKTKCFLFAKKNISVACPTSSSRGKANSAKASPQIKQTCNFHSFRTIACLQKKLSVCGLSN